MLTTPILFLVFNRPATTERVFAEIRRQRPSKLYIACDGPRPDRADDVVACAEVRKIALSVDWPCEVATLFREHNLGCKRAVSGAIAWFFENEEEGIVLEDDILPDPSFFGFCGEMLSRHRGDARVMHVAGYNVCGRWRDEERSHHFCRFGSIWGWASWRRAWRHYDVDIAAWAEPAVQRRILNAYFPAALHAQRKALYDDLYAGKIDTWDYQWTLSRLLNNGLSIAPSRNLVRNIGFGADATHTHAMPGWVMNEAYSLREPSATDSSVDTKYDHLHLLLSTHNISFDNYQKLVAARQPDDARSLAAVR